MGISIEAYRARIGLYHHRLKGYSTSVPPAQPLPVGAGLSSVGFPATVLLILLLIAGVEPNPGPNDSYKCKYCNLAFETIALYSKHVMVHSHWKNFGIQCCFCNLEFKSSASFASHITRLHREMRTTGNDTVIVSQPPAIFKCPVDSCNEKLDSRQKYMDHVPSHFTGLIAYQCKLGTCKSKISEKRQFQIHMCRSHPVATFAGTSSAVISSYHNDEALETFSLSEDTNEDYEIAMDSSDTSSKDRTTEDTTSGDPYPENMIKDDIARFYLKLEGEFMFASSTVQEISLEFQRLTEYSHHCMKRALKQQLYLLHLSEPDVKSIMHSTFKSDPVFNVHHKNEDVEHLASHHLRNKYWHKAFPYVEPKEIYFGGNEAGKKRVAQYVSIRETLQILLKDKDIKRMVLQSFERNNETSSIFQDYHDGSAYSAQVSTYESNKCLQLLLFEDAFDFAAFGPSAGKHKPIGFYYMLGNLPAEYRSKLDLIQLAYMVLEKDTKPTMQEELDGKDILKEALCPLLDELKVLKSEGFDIDDEMIPVCLLFLTGDSLG
ncbi:Zinc finger protein 236 [Frankliniella fusca]|uniref:Zinc finger protein 236 n=1 Tax=Frankliniella fusca TaxID=407009 RepID=A0AAE1LRJ8_9NEOP|nr:Zinc finger protein 236 [Frankliniella fusca]